MPCPWTWPPPPHGATYKYIGVVVHVRGGEGLAYKVGEPIAELVVTLCGEAALLAVQGVENCEGYPSSITMGRKVGWLNEIAQE